MKPINLVCVLKPRTGAVWSLDKTPKGLFLRDDEDNVVLKMTAAEAALRIHLPSFWASRYIVIDRNRGEILCFEPKPKTVGRVKELIEDCLNENPSATAAVMRRKAIRDLLIGGGSFLLGTIVTVVSFALAAPGGTFVVTTGLLAVGLVEIIRGFYWLVKAIQQESRVDAES